MSVTTSRSGTLRPGPSRHDVIIVGGGNAGISLAAKLRRDGFDDVAVIEPLSVHRYRPLLSYVGGGQAAMRELQRPQSRVMPSGVRWYPERVERVDPRTRTVHTGRRRLVAEDLVLCPGVTVDFDAVPGSEAAIREERGCSNYVDDRAPHTWELISTMTAGRAVFVVDDGPVPCAGAALKPVFLAADHWRRTGVLDAIEIEVIIGWDTVFGIDRIDTALGNAFAEAGIHVRTRTTVTAVDATEHRLSVTGPGGERTLDYDLLHLVPRHRAPGWIAASGLAAPDNHDAGMIAVDPTTLAHRRHPRVWGLGDAADVQASRSGGALRKQVPVVAENIARRRLGEPLITYDGYSTAPITTGRTSLVLAEFDRDLRLSPSVPLVDLARRRSLTWFYDRYLQPQLYWHSILAGRVSV